MLRRTFLSLATTAVAAPLLAAERNLLAGHRLARLLTRQVPLTWPRQVGRNAKRDVHGRGPTPTVVILESDQGATGWAELPGGAKALEEIRERVTGRPLSELFHPATGILNADLHPLDLALHDLAGVILGQPVWRMLGATTPHVYPIYSGMIYFDDLDPADQPAGIDQVVRNCAADHALGYRQLKLKIGRGNKWMPPAAGLQRDIDVTRAVARAFPDCQLLAGLGNGASVEGVTCSQEHVDFGENRLRAGRQQVSTAPGFGLRLRKA